jgi:hypothetical protein
MTLEAVLQDKTKIPAGLEAHYVEVDGTFVLDVPGMKTQTDFDKYAEALKKRFADGAADLDKKGGGHLNRDDILAAVGDAFKKFTPGGKPGNGAGGDPAGGDVAQRLHDLERNVASLTEDNTKLTKERDTALSTSRDTTIRNALTEAAGTAGADPSGVPNLVTLTQENFEIAQDGTVVTKLEAGQGVSPNVKPGDYFASIARDKQFRMFWPASKGAGADAGDGGAGGGAGDLGKGNPWTKAGWNMTEQGRVYTADKKEAERLMGVAGVKLGATHAVR